MSVLLTKEQWPLLSEMPAGERNKLKWLLRHAAENGIIADGVAVKFGREWRVCRERVPEFLRRQTMRALGHTESSAAPAAKRTKGKADARSI